MARPKVLHDGFLIPNAGDVTNPRMAEPDRVDFNTLAHPLWGVIEGCEVTVTGSTASSTGGTLIVNGQLVTLSPGSVGLGVSSSQDRFVLVVSDASGALTVVQGAAAVDPVFPDPPLGVTVLAAVFCPTGGTSLSDNVVDKRKFVSRSLLTKIAPTDDLVRNLNGTGNHFLVGGDGKTTWEGDTWMSRTAEATLGIHKHLLLEGTLTAQAASFGGDVGIGGNVNAANLRWATTAPTAPVDPGSIWQSKTDGRIFVWRSGAWQELATINSALPPGTVLTSMEKPSVMMPLGWIPLDGRKVYEADAPSLFSVQGMAHLIVNDTPRYIQLPNARKLTLMTDFDSPPGVKHSPSPNNLVTLTTTNLARHSHHPTTQAGGGVTTPKITISRAGTHTHGMALGGTHDHVVSDPGHRHNGMDFLGLGAAVVALVYGGQNKIDGLFNDRNHTYSVEAMEWTRAAFSNIVVGTGHSAHAHALNQDGAHDHTATMDSVTSHNHTLVEDDVGNGTPFDITPEYLTVYSYVRS